MRAIITILAICLMVLVFQPACNTADETDTAQFTLMVIPAEGVNGVPAAGTFTYDQGEVVSYSYSLEEGYGNLTVTLDGAEVPSSGTVTMNADHVLSAQAGGCAIDVRGRWKGVMIWPFNNPFNIYDVYFDMECFGDLLSGRLEANLDMFPMKEKGTYTVEGCDVRLDIEVKWIITGAVNGLRQSSWASTVLPTGKLIIKGVAEDNNRISGTWELKHVNFNYLATYSGTITRIDRHNYSGTFWLEKE